MHLSIVIPTRNQPAELWFTLQGLLQNLKHLELTWEQIGWEIVVADNDPKPPKKWNAASIVGNLHDPRVRYVQANAVQSPYHPRNVGAEHATGKWLLFLDSHVLLSDTFFDRLVGMTSRPGEEQYPDNSIIHYPVVFNNRNRKHGHYTLKLDTDFWGSWGPVARSDFSLYPIAATGIWAMCMAREWYVDQLLGFNPNFVGYSGGEPYLDLKSWCLGGSVQLDSAVFGSHWSGPRSYSPGWRERIRNFAIAIYVLDPSYIQSFARHYVNKLGNRAMIEDAIQEGQRAALEEAEHFKHRRRYKLSEVLERFERSHVPH